MPSQSRVRFTVSSIGSRPCFAGVFETRLQPVIASAIRRRLLSQTVSNDHPLRFGRSPWISCGLLKALLLHLLLHSAYLALRRHPGWQDTIAVMYGRAARCQISALPLLCGSIPAGSRAHATFEKVAGDTRMHFPVGQAPLRLSKMEFEPLFPGRSASGASFIGFSSYQAPLLPACGA